MGLPLQTVDPEKKYIRAFEERSKHVEAVLLSKSAKKVVVAGPGTGKTFLFKKVLTDKTKTLTLTFVNSLVEDLSLELYGLSDVKTLHGFSRSILKHILNKEIKISPKLSKVIKEDAHIIIGQTIDFDKIFHERDDANEFLPFYEERRKYYDYYGYADIVYAVVKRFEQERKTIPLFEQVVVDEFQDFNRLEVSLIDLLAEKSPVLLAGDDDQALYEFKSASAIHIRDRHGDEMPEYEPFNLPFCARCTHVVVEATNDLLNQAKEYGLLKERINKPFIYFDCKEKDKDSIRYSKINYTQKFATQIPWFIEKSIAEIAEDLKTNFSVLIISPYKKQCHTIAECLKEKGLQNIEYSEKLEELDITLLDGLKLLLTNQKDNLGWRIISKFFLSEEDFNSLLKETSTDPEKNIHELIPKGCLNEVKIMLKVLKCVKDNKPFDKSEYDAVLKRIQIDPYVVSSKFLQEEINSSAQRFGVPAIRKIPIKATTIQSSKGLSADIVFITHFDDLYFIKDKNKKNISDQDICNFIVALTRTKKKVFLISSKSETPTFYKWIIKERIEFIK